MVAEGVETAGQFAPRHRISATKSRNYFSAVRFPPRNGDHAAREKAATCRPNCCGRDSGSAPSSSSMTKKNIIASLRRLLRRDGYRILYTTSAAEDWRFWPKNDVDVVLSDQRMPGMTGVEFLRRAKTIHPGPSHGLVGIHRSPVGDGCDQRGAIYKFLRQPWDDDQLRHNIEEAFRQKELADDNRRLGNEPRRPTPSWLRTNEQLSGLLKSKESASSVTKPWSA